QSTIALLIMKAKCQVCYEITKDVAHLRRIFIELKIKTSNPTPLLSDNQSCIKLVNNPILHAHIEIEHHFICERSQARDIEVGYIPSQFQQSDLFTKPLGAQQFSRLKEDIGTKPCLHII
ncbi:hypothetical protein BDL97_01G109300, partial [Sphagnum fallax]